MPKALCINTIDAIWGDRLTPLPGSARVLWWNSQENAREGGSWIGIENMSGKQHHPAVISLPPSLRRDTSAYGPLPVQHPYGKVALYMPYHAPLEQHAE